jgi:hypothetical protein
VLCWLFSQSAWGVALLAMSLAEVAEWKPAALVEGGGTTTCAWGAGGWGAPGGGSSGPFTPHAARANAATSAKGKVRRNMEL